jgi:hypothetical protein
MMSARIQWLGITLVASCGLLQLGCELTAERSSPAAEPAATGQKPPPPPSNPPIILSPPTPLFGGQTVQSEHSVPVIGGTLLVTRDGQTIVAADPDRDAVFLIDEASRVVKKVSLSRGDEPGRIAEGPDGTLFVALRRAGALVVIDARSAAVVQRAAVCASPRGVAYDAKSASLYVACRSGQLLTLDAPTLSRKRTLQLDTDLRDVIVREHDLVVTRFMSAEVMVIADDGRVSRRAKPPSACGDATVAYRALSLPNGQVALAHQISSNEAVGAGPGGYGSGGSCGFGLVSRLLSMVDTETPTGAGLSSDLGEAGSPGATFDPEPEVGYSPMTFRSSLLPGAGPLDVAFDTQGTRMATIALNAELTIAPHEGQIVEHPGAPDRAATLWLSPWGAAAEAVGVEVNVASFRLPGQPVAVAFSAAGKYIVQSREPATLAFEDGTSLSLSDESHADSGHLMFHMNSGIGIACASCHPEGGDDGHVWRLPEGLRRTMPLEGGVMQRAPFHWDGALGDMSTLVSAVMVSRMGLPQTPSAQQIAALSAFLEQLPALPPADGLDAAAVKRGEALFRRADVACASCHSGPQFTDNRLADVGTGGSFVTPTLLGVGLRPGLFHDGCAKSIVERFGVCGGTAHGKPELLSADERADLIAFLRSL